MNRLLIPLLIMSISVSAQDVKVEFDKNRDLSRYHTFSIGEGEVITPKDQEQKNEVSIKEFIEKGILEELKEKGLQHVDSAGDLIVSYVAGSQQQTDFQRLGPLGTTPGNDSQTWSRQFTMESLIIDLNDKNNNLIWRVNASSTSSTGDMENLVDQIISAGFKKFSLKPKKVKKK